MPSTTTGMDSADEAVIQNAIADQAKVSVVNLMTFDYYTGTSHEMATATETAASGLHSQLASLYPSESPSQLWSMVGVAEMPGIDDYGSGETFTEADAGTVEKWAVSTGINTCRSGPCIVTTAAAGALDREELGPGRHSQRAQRPRHQQPERRQWPGRPRRLGGRRSHPGHRVLRARPRRPRPQRIANTPKALAMARMVWRTGAT